MILANAAFVLLSVLPPMAPQHTPATGPAHIILIRHAEKPADPNDAHLSPTGVKRAAALVSFITTYPAMTALGTPVAVFATRTTKDDDGQRTQETVAPLGRTLRLRVQTPYLGKDFAKLAAMILADPAYAGKTVLVCWNHEEIPQLTAAFGVKPEPPKWKGSVYDLVYVISYRGRKAELATYRYAGG